MALTATAPVPAPAPALPDTDALLQHLYTLVEGPRAEAYLCFHARHAHGVRSVDMDRPCLTLVLQGRKQVRSGASAHSLGVGELLLVRRPCRLDATHMPDPATGRYLSLGIALCDEVLDAARLLWARPVAMGGDDIVRSPWDICQGALWRWCTAIQADEAEQARLALTELLLDLCRAGHAAVLAPLPPRLSVQLRAIVAAEPGRDWQSRDFEDALGLSGATLRRRLQAENSSVRAVITHARLACALELLYSTRWPVKTVAAKVGYRSVESFTRRFSERYGLAPTRIGNT